MAIRDIFKVSRKTFFDPRTWADYDAFKAYNKNLWAILSGLFTSPQPGKKETFQEAMQRFGLKEEDIERTGRNYFIFAVGLAILGVLLFVFGFYLLLYHHAFHGWLISMAAVALCFSQAFRFHFWHFQIKFRKLGCTFEEWKRGKPYDNGTTT